eukprot:1148859-Pelagomonas_calceolata.AAC.2
MHCRRAGVGVEVEAIPVCHAQMRGQAQHQKEEHPIGRGCTDKKQKAVTNCGAGSFHMPWCAAQRLPTTHYPQPLPLKTVVPHNHCPLPTTATTTHYR